MLVFDDQQVERRPVALLHALDQGEIRRAAPRRLSCDWLCQTLLGRPHATPKSSALRSDSRGAFRFREAVPTRTILTQIWTGIARIVKRDAGVQPIQVRPERSPGNGVQLVDEQQYVNCATRAPKVEADPEPAVARARAEPKILEAELGQ